LSDCDQDKIGKAWIAVEIDIFSSRLLSEASKKSGRTKRKEVALRIADHLQRFEAISYVGEAVARNSNVKNGGQS